jgi:hypothetical protein
MKSDNTSTSGTSTPHPGNPGDGLLGGASNMPGLKPEVRQKTKSEVEDPGTGLQYIRCTGTAADGGNFDARKAGAGVRFVCCGGDGRVRRIG